MSDPILSDVKERLDMGILTKAGYVLESVRLLGLDNPMECDRQALADALELTYTATTQNLHRLRLLGLIPPRRI